MRRIFYGWYLVGAAAGVQVLQAGLMMQSFGAYVAVLSEERGWSKTALSGAAALHQMEVAVLGPALGWMLHRFGPRRFLRCGFFPLNVAVIHWFERWRARAISSMSIGLALGGIMVPLVALSLETYGWRATAFASGIIAIVLGFPLASVIRNRPEDIGEVADGVSQNNSRREKQSVEQPAAATRDFTAREALRTRAFWLLSLGHGFALFVVQAVVVHSIAHLKEGLGYSIEQAALVYMLVTVSQIGGVGIGWLIGDRYDKRFIAAACMLMHGTGLLLLTYAVYWPMVLGFALLHGAAWGLRGPFMQALRADYFGRSAIGMILGLSFMIIVIGQVAGRMIAGILADATGNYRSGFTILALLAGLGSLFFVLARRPQR